MKLRSAFDTLIGSVSMYRLVLFGLIALVIQSFIFSAVGILYATPLQLALSLIVLVVVSYVSNRIFALVLRVTPHSESSIITALIIFFVSPTMFEPKDLITLAVIAAIANGSKYVLTYRGRHIFNPAAFGVALVAAFGIGWSSWWLGNAASLPLVAVLSLVILYRTRALLAGLTFAVVGVAIYTAYLTSGGFYDVGSAVQSAIFSYSIVFAAGFMVSEPITLPPRTWQKITVAVVMGACVGWPLTIGTVTLAPEFAILIGNLVAFALTRRPAIRLTLTERRHLTPTTFEFRFATSRPVAFVPGQYLELTLPHRHSDVRGLRRMFSLTSVPGGSELSIGIKIPDERPSSFKRALRELPIGSTILSTGVSGSMRLPVAAQEPVVLVAGGIGITPFVSQLRADEGSGRDITLVYSVSDPSEIAYRDLPGARVILVTSREPDGELPEGWTVIVGRRVDAALLVEQVPDLSDRHAFVSGSPRFIDSVVHDLRGARARRISTDPFFGV